jgi:hypothetical protein
MFPIVYTLYRARREKINALMVAVYFRPKH